MTWWEGVVLGLVQGMTEFLPISSSGHLVVTEAALGLHTPGVMIEVTLHVATLLAVATVYRQTLWRLTVGVAKRTPDDLRYVASLAIATVPAVVVGLTLKEFFERAFDNLTLVGVNFLLTGAILWSTRKPIERADHTQVTAKKAGWIGIAQAFAILPGISRSGSTVSMALWLNIDAVKAAEFSFLMAIPTIAGAAILQIPSLSSPPGGSIGPLALGFAVAVISGVAAIRLLLVLLQRRAFHHFAPYCWLLGVATVTWGIIGA